MAAVTRAVVRKDEDNRMTNKTNNRLTPVAHQPGRLPARTYMSIPTRSVRVTADLYIDDMRASMSVKKVAGAGSPIARRCAFVGHLRYALNTAAVIELFASIVVPVMPEFRWTRYAI
jgi:hypothetical protein